MNYIRWGFGLLFLITGVVGIFSTPLPAIFSVGLGLLLIPKYSDELLQKLNIQLTPKKKILSAVALFILFGATVPKTSSNITDKSSISPTLAVITKIVIATNTPAPTVSPAPTTKVSVTTVPSPTRVPPTWTPYPTTYPTEIVYPTSVPVIRSFTNESDSEGSGNSGGGGYSCNCSKTCGEMSSCAEAQYQLNTCGCSARDGDNDGTACDSDCQ